MEYPGHFNHGTFLLVSAITHRGTRFSSGTKFVCLSRINGEVKAKRVEPQLSLCLGENALADRGGGQCPRTRWKGT